VLRLANNNLTGVLPASVATSPAMFLLDLQGNAIHGSLPSKWNSPRMQLIILENNALTGRAPGSALDAHAIGAHKMQALQLLADLMPSILLFEAAVSCTHLLVGSWPSMQQLCVEFCGWSLLGLHLSASGQAARHSAASAGNALHVGQDCPCAGMSIKPWCYKHY